MPTRILTPLDPARHSPKACLEREIEMFDSLPEQIREALRYCPILIRAWRRYRLLHHTGLSEDEVLADIEELTRLWTKENPIFVVADPDPMPQATHGAGAVPSVPK